MPLITHLHNALRAERRLEHKFAFLDRAGERLLHIDVLSGIHAVDGYVGVGVIWRTDLHRLEPVAHRPQHFPIVRELRDAGKLLLPVVEHG